ncbi:WG repeat-containing protein [Parapedobacter sp.]
MMQAFKYIAVLFLLVTAFGSISAQKMAHGFVNTKDGSKNIPPVYGAASSFSEGLAAVKKGEKWGYIDVNNKAVIDFQFDYARSFKQGRAIVQKGDFYGVIDNEGKFVIPPYYYDLIAYELEGRQYYISRDSTFFQGIIDNTGKEILPHRYTFIITYEPNLSKQRFYKNIPFYSSFQAIDIAKGSFYEQFKENAYRFSPGKGRHDIYDLRFNKLASLNATDYTDGFQPYQLQRVDAFLEEGGYKSPEGKRKAIDSLLALPEPDSIQPAMDPSYVSYGRMTSDEIANYLESLDYRLFTQDGKTGLKKRSNILIPAQHTGLQLVNGVILSPRQADLPVLKAHYGGRYRNKGQGVFDIFAAVPHDGEPQEASKQYSLSGAIELPVREVNRHSKKIISKITQLGFLYLHTTADTARQKTRTYSLVDWKGDELLPAVYQKIEVLKSGHVRVTQEKEVENGIERYFGLFDNKGKEIIPLGVYSDIKPFTQPGGGNLYLAIWSDPYPTVAEKKETAFADKTYLILRVDGLKPRVVNSFAAAGQVYLSGWDAETGMLPYRINNEAHDQQMDN